MQDLTPVGLSQDGRRLLLVSSAGEEFAVLVDTRLRAALRGENARLGQLEMKMESALRPRDIQARIRAGESPEEVAAAAQTTVDAIMGFATPVLAERAHVAQMALRASVRRRSGESSSAGTTLGEAAELFFGDHSLHDEDVEWDAWRRPDGRWALVATYVVAGSSRTAEFSHDLPGRYVIAENDEARILTGELREPEARQPAGGRTVPARRLSSVPSQDELPLGDDAIELVRDREPAADEPTDLTEPVLTTGGETDEQPDLLEAAATETGPDASPDSAPNTFETATADADWIADETSAYAHHVTADVPDGPDPTDGPDRTDRVDAGPGTGPVQDPEPSLLDPADDPAAALDATVDAGPGATAAGKDGPPAPAPKKKSRSSVPSWDEIMFGGGKSE
jgi:hypothetical protein